MAGIKVLFRELYSLCGAMVMQIFLLVIKYFCMKGLSLSISAQAFREGFPKLEKSDKSAFPTG